MTAPVPRPLDDGIPSRIGPFAVVAIAAFLTIPLPPAHHNNLAELAGAAVLTGIVIGTCLFVPWRRLPANAQALPAFLFFGAVAMLRDAEGGAASGFALLVFLPVLWLALYGSRAQLAAGIALAAATVVVPLVAFGGPDYPADEWRRAILLTVVATAMGSVVQRLMGEVRERSAVQDAVARVVRLIAADADARESICDATREVAGASLAMLFEPDGQGNLVSTATAGTDMPTSTLSIGSEPSGSVTAYLTGQSLFVSDPTTSVAVSQRLVAATGVEAVLFEPVLRGDRAVGVLVAGWDRPIRSLPAQSVAAVELLAVEAAVAIERSETRTRLEQLAHTDALTGLPNRRAWTTELDRELARAAREGRPFTVAMLDLDRFKVLNDKLGHAVGDRVLKESAAAWSAQLREVDLLVRYGGEEFAILLHDCRLEDARPTVERVRAVTAAGQTCSAGIAEWDGCERASELIRRADGALYEAKRSGRDRSAAAAPTASPASVR